MAKEECRSVISEKHIYALNWDNESTGIIPAR